MTNASLPVDQLADFLRSRRAVVTPNHLGMVTSGFRRVPGLRREELAELAGVSLTYYTRLEQGAATNPSPQVLDALARALRLDDTETSHLYRLAGTATPPTHRSRTLRPGLATLLDAMPDVAAMALSPTQHIVGWNRLGHAVFAGHLDPSAPYGPTPPNKVAMMFTDPETRALHRDWEHEAHLAVASLRFVVAPLAAQPEAIALIDELSTASEDFMRIWAQHPVQACSSGIKYFHHPVVGALELRYEMLHLPEDDGYRLLLMHAVPGSADDDALRMLASATHPG